jgi:DNA replication protein DnaC
VLLTGPCGTGKTFIACALGHQACLKGYSVKYYRLPRLILALTQAKADAGSVIFTDGLTEYLQK